MSRYKQKPFPVLSALQLIGCICCLTVPLCLADNNETQQHERLYQKVFNTKTNFLPSKNHGKPLKVKFGFHLINIVEVNAKMQFITVYAWIIQKWNNHLLKWNPKEYNGIDKLSVKAENIWVPDILLYNNLDEQDRVGGGPSTYKTRVVIDSNGTNVWASPVMFKSFCRIQVRYFPLDSQTCVLTFGSWTNSLRHLDLEAIDIEFPTKYFTKNGEWLVYNISLYRTEDAFPCCDDRFAQLNFAIYISREAFDYLINLIVPCCLISSMIFLGFILPPESGERIGLSITVLLAMTVFQQLTFEIMPAYDFPILGQYYFAIVLEISASLVVTTVILNFYHRTDRKMPGWVKKLLLHWMSRLVFLHGEVKAKYSINQWPPLNAILQIHTKQLNDKKDQRPMTLHKRNDTAGSAGAGYGDNIYGNDQALDNEGIEMRGPSHINTYPFNIKDMDTRGNERKENRDLEDKERKLRHWEWTLAARILDRCVLIVAIFLGIITVTAVFLRAPALWKDIKGLTVDNPINITRSFLP
ncbi:neuronal acetylcholine receptor subunit alpha-10-like [Actinia tenebrosa]|uniref:Neuronal acetylcholine receptor subunit alpha-10-like n=1 Tax=Actinia tenebrosa TaxID=6105 RepID=A0A6P8HV72_ACTTE|nr:neuronal acetylcholine receptor subunit alpha-10-like [Actinia tenebrosa]XP_031556580.1 neuronal acetylcholine receptor subunit alpha-10-like [Actinia tenebrosa]